jgi:hypothetical protein
MSLKTQAAAIAASALVAATTTSADEKTTYLGNKLYTEEYRCATTADGKDVVCNITVPVAIKKASAKSPQAIYWYNTAISGKIGDTTSVVEGAFAATAEDQEKYLNAIASISWEINSESRLKSAQQLITVSEEDVLKGNLQKAAEYSHAQFGALKSQMQMTKRFAVPQAAAAQAVAKVK